jgi:hypothetical protein
MEISEENIPKLKNLKEIERQQAVGYLRIQIQSNKKEFSELGLMYIVLTKSYLDNAISGLESILHPEEGYILNDETIGFYKALKKRTNLENPTEEIRTVIKELRDSKKRLDDFVGNPNKFYNSEDAPKLSRTLDNLWDSYLHD